MQILAIAVIPALILACSSGPRSQSVRPDWPVAVPTGGIDVDQAHEQLIGVTDLHGSAYDLRDALGCNADGASFEAISQECRRARGGPVMLDGVTLWPLVSTWRNVSGHADTYAETEVVMLLMPHRGELVPVHGLVHWQQETTECATTLLRQMYLSADLTGDGAAELCIETVEEVGEVADHDFTEPDIAWQPVRRRRTLRAYRPRPGFATSETGILARATELDRRCPRTGYRAFAPPGERLRTTRHRADVTGDGTCTGECVGLWQDPCGNRYPDAGGLPMTTRARPRYLARVEQGATVDALRHRTGPLRELQGNPFFGDDAIRSKFTHRFCGRGKKTFGCRTTLGPAGQATRTPGQFLP